MQGPLPLPFPKIEWGGDYEVAPPLLAIFFERGPPFIYYIEGGAHHSIGAAKPPTIIPRYLYRGPLWL